MCRYSKEFKHVYNVLSVQIFFEEKWVYLQ